ncbi:hypothetical protein BOTBODRAFT_181491 [Botryobasidium botryosum FD-172 SS1]|uniref:F-box domain-containing protein n=1 Tax=Botryobasidium botryosum (strain FD-172 SS1) TaxID=930990 RepID=A0A067M3V1_BOTB1|nr:hypothetical protein BOTBODRAFT_181491 [Botryobasidium botryosum FD-172 SS1]
MFPARNTVVLAPSISQAITKVKITFRRNYSHHALLNMLEPCTNPKELWIGALSISTTALDSFPSPHRVIILPNLTEITLSGISKLNTDTLTTILPRCALLSSVVLRGTDLVTAQAAPFEIPPPELLRVTSLDATGQAVLDALLEQLFLPEAGTLRVTCFSSSAVSHLLRRCPRARTLDVDFTHPSQTPAPYALPSVHLSVTLPYLSHVHVHYRDRSISFISSEAEGRPDEGGLLTQAELNQDEIDAINVGVTMTDLVL